MRSAQTPFFLEHIANPIWDGIFESSFKAQRELFSKALSKLFTETWQRRRSNFEPGALKQLSKMSPNE